MPPLPALNSTSGGRVPLSAASWVTTYLVPRNILTQYKTSQDQTSSIPLFQPSDEDLKAKLGDVLVALTPQETSYLQQMICNYLRDERDQASWAHDVYQEFFFKNRRTASGSTITRLSAQCFVWHGPNQNTAAPSSIPSLSSQETKTNNPLAARVYQHPPPPLSRLSFERGTLSEIDLNDGWPGKVDLSYTTQPNGQKHAVRFMQQLPAFDAMPLAKNGHLPAYLYVQIGSSSKELPLARARMAFIAACALHDRLLLRELATAADTRTGDGVIRWDPALSVYVMTCCAELCEIYVMAVQDTWSAGAPIKYVMTCMAILDLTEEGDIRTFQEWLNKIHYYGVTSHCEAAMADGNNATDPIISSPSPWKAKSEIFYCGKEDNVLDRKCESRALVSLHANSQHGRGRKKHELGKIEGV